MVRSSKKPAELRDTWRAPAGPDARTRWGRRGRRFGALALLLGLIAVWYYALFQPVWHPNVHLFTAAAVDYQEPVGREQRFARTTAEAVRARTDGILASGGGDRAVLELKTPDDFARLGERLQADVLRGGDVAVVWLQAQGVVLNGRPYLLCENFTIANPDEGRYPLENVLQLVRQSSAGVKLLLLDAGGRDHDPRLGVVVNDFPRLAKQAVEATGDENLWLLNAYSPLERSNVDPGLKQTVFGHYAARALSGEADRNRDHVVDVGELFYFVRENVAAWVVEMGGGFGKQTPMLVCGRSLDGSKPSSFPTIVPVPLDLEALIVESPPEPTAAPAAPAPSATPSATAPAIAEAKTAPTPPVAKPSGTAATPKLPEPTPTSADVALLAAARPALTIAPANVVVPRPDMTSEQLLELNRDALATLADRSRGLPTPNDYAPHRWQEVVDATYEFERRWADPTTDRKKLEPTLRRYAAALAAVAQGGGADTNIEPLKRLAEWRAPPTFDAARLPTFALVERLAAENGPSVPAELQSFASALDEAFSDPAGDAWYELLAKPWPAAAGDYDEFRFARRLAALGGVAWPTLQWAWRTCREGEQAAADLESRLPSVAAEIVAADRFRESARRTLFDQIGADWSARCEADFRRALIGYRAAAAESAELHRAEQLQHDLLANLSTYIDWHLAGVGDAVGSPSYEDLVNVLEETRALANVLSNTEHFDVAACADRRRRLERMIARIEAPLHAPTFQTIVDAESAADGRRRRIEILSDLPLLPPPTRRSLEEAAARLDAEAKPLAAVAPEHLHVPFVATSSPDDAKIVGRRLDVDLRRAKLADFDDSAPPLPTDLAAFYDRLPGHCDQVVRRELDLSQTTDRANHLQLLVAADRGYRLIYPRDDVSSTSDSPTRVLNRAHWYDLLSLNRRRFLRRRADVDAAEAQQLAAAAERLAEAARTLPLEPAPSPIDAEVVRLVGPPELSPGEDAAKEFVVGLEYVGASPAPVWIDVAYDPELLDLKLPAGLTIYDDRELRAEVNRLASEAAAAADRAESLPPERRGDAAALRLRAEQLHDATLFPLNPQLAGLKPSLEMSPGDFKELKFGVRRRSTAVGRTAIVVKVVSGAAHVRQKIEIALPPLDTIGFAPAAGSASWSRRPDGLVLHPWPNRTSEYEFQLTNLGSGEAVVDVEFIAPEKRPDGTLPRTLRTVQTSEVLSLVGPSRTVVKIDELKLPAGGAPVTLAAPKPKDAAEPPKTPDEKNRADSTVGRSAADDKDKPPPIPVRHGMLLVVRRRDNGETLLRRIDFRPERPRRYVKLKVGYNPALERIEIRATPVDRATFPKTGVEVRLEFPEPLAKGTEAQLQGLVQAPDYEALMYVEAPPSDTRVQTVFVTVDGYPRAFVYRVPCGPASADLPEADDLLDVRLTAPATNAMYSAPADSIAVEAQVDAPPGSFEFDRDVLEVGIDRDRDRDFSGEATLVLHSDRQADVFVESFGTNGIVAIRADVHDFKLAVPGAALQNVRVNLVGRVQVGPRTAWSRPVEIGLDAAPPQIARIELKPDRLITAGADLEVNVWSVDNGMSGTAEVEVGFDVDRTGTFSEKKPPVKAVAGSPPQWTAKLPTADVPTGPVTLLIRSKDKLGHTSEITKVKIEIVSPTSLTAAKALASRVVGSVRYGGQPLEKAVVVLQTADAKEVGAAESDVQGRFTIEGVPAGTYKLAARGLAKNRPRMAEQQIVVPPPPAKAPRVELDLK